MTLSNPSSKMDIPRRKGLRKKIISAILIIGILPLILGVFLTYMSERKILANSIGTNFEAIAKETADKIEMTITNELIDAQNLALLPDILKIVTSPNRHYGVLQNSLSIYLKSLLYYEKDFYSIMVTDEGGFVVASTDANVNHYQGKEIWWKEAYNHGRGKTYISDIYPDQQGKNYLMEIAVPVMPQEQGHKKVIGVIRVLYKTDQVFKVIEGVKIGLTGHANLISETGDIIICPIFPPKSHRINEELLKNILSNSSGWGIAEDDGHGGKDSIVGYAPVGFREQVNGDSSIKDWYIFIRQNPHETYTSIYNLLIKVSLSVLFLIGGFVLLGVYFANRLIGPILLLREEAELIGRGNLDHRVRIHTKDEIESLAEEFNRMAERLKESLSQLKRERDKLELILISAGEGIAVADSENKVIMVNPVAEEILGITQKEVLGRSIFQCHKNPERVADVLNYKGNLPFPLITSLGSRIVEINVTAIKSEEGPIGSVMVMKDITSIKKMEEDLKHYSVGLERMVEERTREIKKTQEQMSRTERLAAIGQLSMGIAHEINNPLSGMLNCVRTLIEERHDESFQKKYLGLIEKGLNRIEYIVRQLLGFAKEYQFEFSPHNIDDLILETMELIKYKIERGNITLQLNLNCNKKRYLMPGNHIQQVILNIVMNAIQAMPKGGLLAIGSEERKDDLVVSIADTGIGIPRENLNRIFDPFFTTKDVGEGTGLGLSLSYGIIEKLGGQIEVSSEVGKGSNFRVSIPKRDK